MMEANRFIEMRRDTLHHLLRAVASEMRLRGMDRIILPELQMGENLIVSAELHGDCEFPVVVVFDGDVMAPESGWLMAATQLDDPLSAALHMFNNLPEIKP